MYDYENRDNSLNSDDDQSINVRKKNSFDLHNEDEESDSRQRDDEPDAYQNDGANDNQRSEKKKKEKKERKIYQELNKDLQATNERINSLTKEWRSVKSAIHRSQNRSEDDDDIEDYDELPQFPRKTFKHVILMEENLKTDSYKRQFVSFSFYG